MGRCVLNICAIALDAAVDAAHAVTSVHVRTLDGAEEMPERGCRRFEVALILSRQGGDCSRGIVLRVHRFGMLSDQRGTRQSGCSV